MIHFEEASQAKIGGTLQLAKLTTKPLISIIIPIYNVEKFLEKTLLSAISQTLLNIEIICIDDCSTDKSFTILQDFSKIDKRIKIFKNLQNSGVGFTRNVGLEHATANFIMFLDSDDFIATDFCEKMYNAITSKTADGLQVDLVVCNANNIFDESFTRTEREVKKDRNYATITSHMIWNKIFRRDLIERSGLRFPTDVKGGEDVFFTICYRTLCKNITLLDEKLYNYLIRSGSLMSATGSKDNERMFDSFIISDHIYNFFKSNDILDKVYDIYFQNLIFAISNFTEINYDRIAKIIFESLKQKPEIEILEESFKVLGKEYKINPIIFEKVKKLQIINQKIGDLKL